MEIVKISDTEKWWFYETADDMNESYFNGQARSWLNKCDREREHQKARFKPLYSLDKNGNKVRYIYDFHRSLVTEKGMFENFSDSIVYAVATAMNNDHSVADEHASRFVSPDWLNDATDTQCPVHEIKAVRQ